MDRTKNYTKCYAILGVFPDDDWTTVRNAYQRQIRRWHPDRFQNRSHQELAEEKTKALNYAYHELSDYHRRFGALPADGSSSATTHSSHPAPASSEENFNDQARFQASKSGADPFWSDTESEAPRRRRFGGPAAAVTILALAYLVWGGEWFTSPEQEDLWYAMEIDSTKPGKDLPVELFGRPSGTDKTTIRAGNMERSSQPGKSLRQTDAFSSSQSSYARPLPDSNLTGLFGRDSSKTEVLTAQGPPLRQTEHVWYYGTSRVFFRYDKVSGWYESPTNPLNAVRVTDKKLANN